MTSIDPRAQFVCASGTLFLSADWSQIELRMLAHLSADQSLIRLLSNRECPDVFRAIAAEWLSKPPESVDVSLFVCEFVC